jgi:hypothetical protein
MKTDVAPEIVEVIDDDYDVFGYGVATHSVDNSGVQSRWVGPAAAVALLALVGYGVATSATESSITTPVTPVAPELIDAVYYVADPPPAFSMYLAESRDSAGNTDLIEPGAAELWATPNATATTGSWFVASRDHPPTTSRNSYRKIVDGIEVIIEHDPETGQARLSFTKNGIAMGITSFGWIDRQLIRLVRSINFDNGAIGFSDGFFTPDHRRIARADPAAAMFGVPVTRVGYTTGLPTELADSFTITVAADSVDHASALRFAMADISSLTIGGQPAIIGRAAADPTVSIAQWHDGERLITIRGDLDAERLEAVANTVHQGSDSAVQFQLAATNSGVARALQVEPQTVVSGMLSDGWPWSVELSLLSPDDPGAGYLWWIAQPGDSARPSETQPSLPGDQPRIDTLVEHGRSYVLASIPRSMAGAELHVNPTGLPSIVTPLRDIDPAFPAEFAASVFLEPVPFTAQIIDADGRTVASWPTFAFVGS